MTQQYSEALREYALAVDFEDGVDVEGVPTIPNIHAAVLERAKADPRLFGMAQYRSVQDCGTVRCIVGWVDHLARKVGTESSAEFDKLHIDEGVVLVYLKSDPKMDVEDVPCMFPGDYLEWDGGEYDEYMARVNALAIERLEELARGEY
jgi:hypothetical protein